MQFSTVVLVLALSTAGAALLLNASKKSADNDDQIATKSSLLLRTPTSTLNRSPPKSSAADIPDVLLRDKGSGIGKFASLSAVRGIDPTILAQEKKMAALEKLFLRSTESTPSTHDGRELLNQVGSTLTGEQNEDQFGRSVALSGNGVYLIAGASHVDDQVGNNRGAAQVFKYDGAEYQPHGNVLTDDDAPYQAPRFGYYVDISDNGSIVAVGNTRGRIKVFWSNGSSQYTLTDIIDRDIPYTGIYGETMALSGDGLSLVQNGQKYDAINSVLNNHLYVHKAATAGATYTLMQELTEQVPDQPSRWDFDLSRDGNVLAIGDSPGEEVRVYESNDGWASLTQRATVSNPDTVHEDQFGRSVSLSHDGTYLAVAAPRPVQDASVGCDLNRSGRIQEYVWSGSSYDPRGSPLCGDPYEPTSHWGQFGLSAWSPIKLSGDGNKIAVARGTYSGDSYLTARQGQARLFSWNGISAWVQEGAPIFGETDNDCLGCAASLSGNGNALALGARQDDDDDEFGNTVNTGFVRVYGSVVLGGSPSAAPSQAPSNSPTVDPNVELVSDISSEITSVLSTTTLDKAATKDANKVLNDLEDVVAFIEVGDFPRATQAVMDAWIEAECPASSVYDNLCSDLLNLSQALYAEMQAEIAALF